MSAITIAPQTNITIVRANGHHRPKDFQADAAFDGVRPLVVRAAPILDGEDDNQDKNQRDEKNRHRDQKINTARRPVAPWSTLVRETTETQIQSAASFACDTAFDVRAPQHEKNESAARASTVAAPAERG